MRNIYLIGRIGAGKTAVGSMLAEALEWGFVDMDETVEAIYQQSIEEIHRVYGAAAFQDMEAQLLQELSQGNQQVIACSEGIVKNDANLALIKATGLLFWLEAPVETLVKRSAASKYAFMVGEDKQRVLREWLEEREFLYRQADVVISTVEHAPAEVATAIRKIAFQSGKYEF